MVQTSPDNFPELQLEQVSVMSGFGSLHLIDQMSFTVERGSRLGIMGASGSGKTTLLRLLNRLLTPTQGQILWQGKPLSTYVIPMLRQQVMLVPQEPRLLGMTVAQSLAYPLQLQQVEAAVIQQRVHQWCQRLEIPEAWRSRQELELSVGQRQWVSLGRALIAQPQVLLLDEPTSALDSGKVDQLLNILQSLDCTILLVSHQSFVVEKLCDRLLWIEQGRLHQDAALHAIDWQQIQTAVTRPPAETTAWDALP